MAEPKNYMNLPNWLGIVRLTEDEKLILNSQDAIPIVRVWEQKIIFDEGAIDDRFLKILFYSSIIRRRKRASKKRLIYEPIKDSRIYKTFIEMTKFYNERPKEWYNYVDDMIDLNIPVLDKNFGVNPEYIYKMHEAIKRHSNILSAFSGVNTVNNSLSFIWEFGLHNIVGFSFLINLLGYARDYMYENYGIENVPISACEGRKGIKDCLYMIIEKKYPDFYTYNDCIDLFERHFSSGNIYYKLYNFSEIMKNVVFSGVCRELTDQIEWELASKYDLWYKDYRPLESKMVAKDRIRRMIESNENKRKKFKR